MSTIKLKYPFGGVVEEVAIMGDANDGAGEALQELFKPINRFSVKMVGGLVEQQHVGFGEQQFAQGYATFFTARQNGDAGIPRGQSQCVGRDFELQIEIAAITRRDDGFEPCLLGC